MHRISSPHLFQAVIHLSPCWLLLLVGASGVEVGVDTSGRREV
jgi:hypothetical protein